MPVGVPREFSGGSLVLYCIRSRWVSKNVKTKEEAG